MVSGNLGRDGVLVPLRVGLVSKQEEEHVTGLLGVRNALWANVPTKQLAMTKIVENALALHQSKRYNAILRLAQVTNSHNMYQTRNYLNMRRFLLSNVYSLPQQVKVVIDGKWSEWSDFTQCSKTCGGGTTTRLRHCNNPSPKNGGKLCHGDSIQQKKCTIRACRK